MKLSLAVVALAAGAHAFNVPPEADFDFSRFRVGHTGVARDLKEREAAPAPEAEAAAEGRNPRYGHQNQYNAPIFVETGRLPSKGERRPCHGKHGKGGKGGFLSSLLTRLGFVSPQPFGGIRSVPQGEHRLHHGHGHDAPQKTKDSEAPEAGFAHILPIFGEGEPHRVVGEYQPSNGAETFKWIVDEFGSIADLESEEPEPEHKHKEHKHKEHKHKEHEHGKEHKHKGKKNKNKSKGGKKYKHKHHKDKGKMYSLKKAGNKLCDALAELPPALRGFVVGALIGSMFQVLFSLVFLAEARKAAKAAYKANKAARKSKAAEAGYDEEEALPSYAEGETDALVIRQ
ncbi:hypothetical protein CcaverHIS002_0401110 [Cutaneotrichosporon cavernicola]|nr:hypothetical protein CcaverHIS002_0401110 [Cutaneotrichosporon cavernicola]